MGWDGAAAGRPADLLGLGPGTGLLLLVVLAAAGAVVAAARPTAARLACRGDRLVGALQIVLQGRMCH